jgi:hypothetical protein
MPVLGQDDVREPAGETVDDRNHLVAARNGKRALRAEIVLNIDDEQNVMFAGRFVAHRGSRK